MTIWVRLYMGVTVKGVAVCGSGCMWEWLYMGVFVYGSASIWERKRWDFVGF